MKVSEMYPSRYATGEELQGKAYTLKIARVVMEEMHPAPGSPAERRPVIYFEGTQKGVIGTRPLMLQIAEILDSEETDDWTGKTVVIYPYKMTVAGQPRTAIRARKAAQA